MNNQVVTQGYKNSKVGVIPEDWEVVKLGEIAQFYKGKGISKANISNDGIDCIRYGELYTKYNEKIENIISKTSISKEQLFLSETNDILIPASGETAIDLATASCVLKKDIGIGGDINIIRSKLNGIFLSYYLNVVAKNRIASLAQGISVIHLYSSQLKNLYISYPPLKEQEKIAGILTTWDNAISKQEELVKAKEEVKKGLMQKLLSGEVRFDGFFDEWEEIPLKKALIERKIYSEKGLEFVHVSLTKEGVVPKSNRYERDFLVKDDNKKYKITYLNDICYNPANLKFGVICKNTLGTAIFSPIYITFELNKNHNIDFFGYLLTTNDFINRVRKYEQGTVYERMAVSPKDFLSYRLKLPSLKEQQKIAEVLSDADKEIDLLKNELEELKEQKKGLMQKLLTGEVRVKV